MTSTAAKQRRTKTAATATATSPMTAEVIAICPFCGESNTLTPDQKMMECCKKARSRSRPHRTAVPANGWAALPARAVKYACEVDAERFHEVEENLERRFWVNHVEVVAVEARIYCTGCPIQQACGVAARNELHTGIAGGRVWHDGAEIRLANDTV